MKKLAIYSFLVLLSGALFFSACETQNPMPDQEESILPDQLTIEIPSSLIEDGSGLKSAYRVDTLKGHDVYRHLRFFIHVGNHGARMVRHIMWSIRVYDIDRIKTLTYESEDDGRIKNLVVVEGPEFDGRIWTYGLTITDATRTFCHVTLI